MARATGPEGQSPRELSPCLEKQNRKQHPFSGTCIPNIERTATDSEANRHPVGRLVDLDLGLGIVGRHFNHLEFMSVESNKKFVVDHFEEFVNRKNLDVAA